MASPQVAVERAARLLRERLNGAPPLALVLGSGLGALTESFEEPVSASFDELPGFPRAGVAGHEGRFVRGRLDGVDVLLQSGRVHGYEGADPERIAAPVSVLASLGVHTLVMTNAAGGIAPGLAPGDLVLVEDQIDLTFRAPSMAPLPRGGTARPATLRDPFDADVREAIWAAARASGIELRRGTYAGLHGPSYETRAEIRMLARLGVDVVGMSTVSEVAVAHALGLRVAVISLVTNLATGRSAGTLSHEEVLAVGEEAGGRLARLLRAALPRLVRSDQSTGAK